jgi:hypothetical protein
MAGALDVGGRGAVVLVVDGVKDGAGCGIGGASGEHAVRTRASAAHAAALRPIRPA